MAGKGEILLVKQPSASIALWRQRGKTRNKGGKQGKKGENKEQRGKRRAKNKRLMDLIAGDR